MPLLCSRIGHVPPIVPRSTETHAIAYALFGDPDSPVMYVSRRKGSGSDIWLIGSPVETSRTSRTRTVPGGRIFASLCGIQRLAVSRREGCAAALVFRNAITPSDVARLRSTVGNPGPVACQWLPPTPSPNLYGEGMIISQAVPRFGTWALQQRYSTSPERANWRWWREGDDANHVLRQSSIVALQSTRSDADVAHNGRHRSPYSC